MKFSECYPRQRNKNIHSQNKLQMGNHVLFFEFDFFFPFKFKVLITFKRKFNNFSNI